MSTPYAPVTYTGDGTTASFSVPFEYLDRSDVVVTVNSVKTTSFTWTSATTIHLNSAPASGAAVKLARVTPYDAPVSVFKSGNLDSNSLNRAVKQPLFALAEAAQDGLPVVVDVHPVVTAPDVSFSQNSGTTGIAAPAITINDALQETLSVRRFGATGDGSDQTAAINNALAVGQNLGKPVEFGAGYFGISNTTDYYCLLNPGTSIIGAPGIQTVIYPLPGTTNGADLLHVVPVVGWDSFLEFRNILLYPSAIGGVKRGKCAIGIYPVNAGNNMAEFRMDHVYCQQGNDYSVDIEGNISLNVQGNPSNSSFTNCFFYDGFKAIGMGDSNKWDKCHFETSSASRNGLDLYMTDAVVGGQPDRPSIQEINNCNFTAMGSHIRAYNGRHIKIVYCNLESSAAGATGGANHAGIDLDGSSAVIQHAEIYGCHMAAFGGSTAQSLIRINGVQGAVIEDNSLLSGFAAMPKAIDITGSAVDTFIGRNALSDGFVTKIADAGTGTMGIRQSVSTFASPTVFSNKGAGFRTLSYSKDKYGVVKVEGSLTATGTSAGAGIFAFPGTSYNPPQTIRVMVGAIVGGSYTMQPVDVTSTGSVIYQGTNCTTLDLNFSFATDTNIYKELTV